MIRAGADARPLLTTSRAGAGPAFLAGFQGNRRATDVHRPLEVRSLALVGDDGRPFVLAVADLIGLVRHDTLMIRSSVADLGADVVVCATHTHSGPDTIGLWGPDEMTRGVDEGFLSSVSATIGRSIRAALGSLEPTTLRAGTSEVDGLIRNLRDPEIVDRQVCVVACERPDGSPIATLVNVGVHPEVLDGDSTLVSPDLAGACRDEIDARRGGVTSWISGDLGGMQSPEEGPRTPAEVARKGALVAEAALSALEGAVPARGRVRVASTEVQLPLWNPRFRAGLGAGLLRGELGGDGSLATEVAVVDLGVARAACWPGEVLPRLGLASRARLDVAVPLLVGLANDELGYILPEDDFVAPTDWDDPDPHYEESMSVGPETGPRLLTAIDGLLAGWNDASI